MYRFLPSVSLSAYFLSLFGHLRRGWKKHRSPEERSVRTRILRERQNKHACRQVSRLSFYRLVFSWILRYFSSWLAPPSSLRSRVIPILPIHPRRDPRGDDGRFHRDFVPRKPRRSEGKKKKERELFFFLCRNIKNYAARTTTDGRTQLWIFVFRARPLLSEMIDTAGKSGGAESTLARSDNGEFDVTHTTRLVLTRTLSRAVNGSVISIPRQMLQTKFR
jgi:hypothetical protein